MQSILKNSKASVIEIMGLFPWFGPGSIGGVQLSGRLAWEGLQILMKREGKEVYLFCYGNQTNKNELYEYKGGTIKSSKIGAILFALQRKWKTNVVLCWHLHLLKLLPFFRIPSSRVVLFLHGIEAWRKSSLLEKILLQRVHLFLSNSNFTWKRFLDFHPELSYKLHRTVYLGLGKVLSEPTPQPAPYPVCLMLARMLKSENYKGHRELIEAWPLVLHRLPKAKLWIVGDGDLREELENRVNELGLQDKIRFLGRVSEEKKQNLIMQCRCLALPSRGEGFGLVYLEAMRLGRPCLVSRMDAGLEVVNPPEAGLSADPQNLKELAEMLCKLLTPGSVWEKWSYQARRRYEEHFTARHFQNRFLSALSLEVRL